jgi:hypothetical protein
VKTHFKHNSILPFLSLCDQIRLCVVECHYPIMAPKISKVNAKPSNKLLSRSENSSKNDPLDFSSINTRMVCALPNLQSRILDHLFLFLQCANEDDQIQNIHSAVDGLTELYQEARPSDLSQESSVDKETYPAEAFLCMLWSLLAMIVRMIPYTHPKQELVLSFFKTLRERKVGIAFVWGVRVPSFAQDHTSIFKFMIRLIQILF